MKNIFKSIKDYFIPKKGDEKFYYFENGFQEIEVIKDSEIIIGNILFDNKRKYKYNIKGNSPEELMKNVLDLNKRLRSKNYG